MTGTPPDAMPIDGVVETFRDELTAKQRDGQACQPSGNVVGVARQKES